MRQALYRKYRSKSLGELVGQEHVTKTLANAIKAGQISHAYLLTGPRGTGKTSIARIIAHEINNLAYDGENTHLDIIEIDAASNNGVEDVRDLRDKVRLAPTSAKYKVYIIDEVHMLSGAAFNALLKTLEEPPAHAVFVLATTEVHKLPATIISRTQRFQLQPIPQDKVIAHLRHIAKQEHIAIDDEALTLVAAHGEGAFRDSISLLDQLSGSGQPITAAVVESTLGLAPTQVIATLLDALRRNDTQQVVLHYHQLLAQGATAPILTSQLMTHLSKIAATEPRFYDLIDQLIDVPRAFNPTLKLEVVLAKCTLTQNSQAPPSKAPPSSPQKPVIASTPTPPSPPSAPAVAAAKAVVVPTVPSVQPETTSPQPTVSSAAEVAPTNTEPLGKLGDVTWQKVVAATRDVSPTLYTVVRQAIPHFDVEKQLLTLTFRFGLHQKRLEESAHAHAFRKILQNMWGSVPEIQIVHNKNAVRNIDPPKQSNTSAMAALPDNPDASSVLGVMGGGEVVKENISLI